MRGVEGKEGGYLVPRLCVSTPDPSNLRRCFLEDYAAPVIFLWGETLLELYVRFVLGE